MRTTTDLTHGGRWRRLAWFALIWCASLAFWLALAYAVRLLLGA